MAQIFGSSGSSNTTQTAALDPQIKQAFLDNYASGRSTASALPMQTFAPRTGDYMTGSDVIRQTALGGEGLDNIGAGAAITGANAMTRSTDNMGAYMNPYLQTVAGNTLSDLGRAYQMTLNANKGDAIANNAFGGSRDALVRAESGRNFIDRAGNTLANIYSQGFDTAAGLQSADLGRFLQAGQQLASIGGAQQQQGYASGQALTNLGLADQEFAQQQIDAPRNLMLEQQAVRNQALGVNPAGGSGNISSSTSKSRQGLFK